MKTNLILLFGICMLFSVSLHGQFGVDNCFECRDNSATGRKSMASGLSNNVSGHFSAAIGSYNRVNGDYSFVTGYQSFCDHNFSAIIGSKDTITQYHSYILGSKSKATGQNSLVVGNNSKSLANYAISIGHFVHSTSSKAFTIGMGQVDNPLINSSSQSLFVGFNSNLPTFIVDRAPGVNKTGKIGIGNITSPTAKLHIKADYDEDATLKLDAPGTNKVAKLILADDDNTITAMENGGMSFHTPVAGSFKFINGKVGIGTSTPSETLDVEGTLRVSSLSSTTTKMIVSTTSGKLSTMNIPAGDNLGNHTATQNINLNGKYLSGDGTNKGVFVNALGNVGIGTNAPGQKLQIADGDIFIEDIDRGIIMKSPDGNCWRGTVNNSGLLEFAQIDCSTPETGINSAGSSNIPNVKIYPNPAGNQVFITADTKTQLTLQINDISGRLISSQQLNNSESYIDLSGYPSGVYLFKLTDVQGNHIFSQKVIKE